MENFPESNGEASRPHAGKASPANAAPHRVARVWVVDDHDQVRAAIVQLIDESPAFKCKRQFDSAEAVLSALAEERPPDVVLLDVNLKGRTGLSAIPDIRKLAPTVKVVMMTTFTNSYYEVNAFRSGASAFLLKTYEPTQIVAVVKEALRRPGARDLFPNLGWHEERVEKLLGSEKQANKPQTIVRAFQQWWNARSSKKTT